MSYSQNDEEEIISTFFGDFKGHLLSLGENDGITLSNSRALIEKGWTADLVEPSPRVFTKLMSLYQSEQNFMDPTIKLHNVAIGRVNCKAAFYDSGTLLGTGDESLVSTLVTKEKKRWGNSVEFTEIQMQVITVKDLLEQTMKDAFDFVSIDCEGYDLEILEQIDFNYIQTKLVCVEFNGINEQAYWDVVHPFGFRLLHKNAENLIYVR